MNILKFRKLIIAILLVVLAVVIYLLVKPKAKEEIYITHDMVLQQVEELGRLEVVRYNISDIMEYKKIRTWLPNSKTALIVVGEVIACVDLTKIGKDDITVIGDSVSILLPTPEICHFKIDHARSRVYDVQYGLWDTHKLVDEAYQEAERQLYARASEMGIARESRESAVKVLSPLFHAVGFRKVHIDFKKSPYEVIPEQKSRQIIPPA